MNIFFTKRKLIVASALLTVLPFVVSAQTSNPTLDTIYSDLLHYLDLALILLMAAAVVMFVFYIIKYFILPTDNRGDAGKYIMWSIIGFFVVLSFWGIVAILQNTFGLGNESYESSSWTSIFNLFPSSSSGSSQPITPVQYDSSPFTAQPLQLQQ